MPTDFHLLRGNLVPLKHWWGLRELQVAWIFGREEAVRVGGEETMLCWQKSPPFVEILQFIQALYPVAFYFWQSSRIWVYLTKRRLCLWPVLLLRKHMVLSFRQDAEDPFPPSPCCYYCSGCLQCWVWLLLLLQLCLSFWSSKEIVGRMR